ncbi:hypothetical protein OJ996_09280 [Luteolibacter sp. GHJ8]|uniref:Uncharacterized protein n=1 Tax=Luteolibacter rhizosphaerae TaxID=2989719 RepID=A0ABT3G1Q5_9BACT|nr:hypothetical protein [Luteolibacter rhizosphaerae]MCW1913766.1 hypothetical protein [Luteolibacter rhizosphaerae]
MLPQARRDFSRLRAIGVMCFLALTAFSSSLASPGEDDTRRFITLTEDGVLAGTPWIKEKQPEALPPKGFVAEIEVQETGIGAFCEILTCYQVADWTKALTPSDRPTGQPKTFHFYLDGLPAKQSFTFLFETDLDWKIKKVGHFRCFPTTDSAVFFVKVPEGNFVVACLDLDQRLSTKKLVQSPARKERKRSWSDLADFKIDSTELLQHLNRRKLSDGNYNSAE